jgi:phosphoglycolate phosphatase
MQLSIVFDLDGTLIDSAPDIHAAVNRALVALGMQVLPFAQIKGFIGNGAPVLVSRCLVALGHDPVGELHQTLFRKFLEFYEDSFDLTVLYPNVLAALHSLTASGHRLGICTNKPHSATVAVLRHFGLTNTFRQVIGGDSLHVRKPDAAPLRKAINDLGGGPALFIGDSEVDCETAAAASEPFWLFTEGYRKSSIADMNPTASFSDFSALPDLVASL